MTWTGFITGFCEVQFLCYEGHPNWLGWLILLFGACIVAAMISLLLYLDQHSR